MKNFVHTRALRATRELFGHLDRLGDFLPQLGLRFLLAYEFWESGVEKFHGADMFWSHPDRETTRQMVIDAGFTVRTAEVQEHGGEKHYWVMAKRSP